jgi:hypothetical protein
MMGLHLIRTDRPLEKCRKEGECRSCGIRRIGQVQLVGGDNPLGFIPLCPHCEDEWKRGERDIADALTREEAAFIVRAMGLEEARRFLRPLDYGRSIEAARDEVRYAA